jgi:hypothetical protein
MALGGIVARNIRRLRLESGLTQEVLAVDARIDRTHVSRLERGLENPIVAVRVQGGASRRGAQCSFNACRSVNVQMADNPARFCERKNHLTIAAAEIGFESERNSWQDTTLVIL